MQWIGDAYEFHGEYEGEKCGLWKDTLHPTPEGLWRIHRGYIRSVAVQALGFEALQVLTTGLIARPTFPLIVHRTTGPLISSQ